MEVVHGDAEVSENFESRVKTIDPQTNKRVYIDDLVLVLISTVSPGLAICQGYESRLPSVPRVPRITKAMSNFVRTLCSASIKGFIRQLDPATVILDGPIFTE